MEVATEDKIVGKTCYLDHNVLNSLVKRRNPALVQYLKSEFLVIYSSESVYEIERSLGQEAQFVELLEELNARYFSLRLDDQNEFLPTGTVLKDKSPRQIFEAERNQVPLVREIQHTQRRIPFKVGIGTSPELTEKIAALHEKFMLLGSRARNYTGTLPVHLAEFISSNTPLYGEVSDLHREVVTALDKLPETSSSAPEFRTLFKISPKELNNINPPNVIQQIWNLASKELEKAKSDMTLEQFLLLDTQKSMVGKIGGIYTVLNQCGYYPDKIGNPDHFNASLADQRHIANAAFTSGFITMDKRCAKKAEAIYEYLGITTTVCLLPNYTNDPNHQLNHAEPK